MPVSKKRKKKKERKPSGPPISKKELASRKRKITRRQIFIYVFSALIILSFILSFLVGSGGGTHSGEQSGAAGTNGDGTILLTPVPSNDDTQAENGAQPQDDDSTSSETDAEDN